jgi:hypothetical protein
MSALAAPRGDGGFSLVEALASLVILSLIALMLISGVTSGRRVWERIDGRQSRGEELETAQNTLRERIEGAFPETRFESQPPYADFAGAPGSVVFLAAPARAERPAILRRYTLGVAPGGQLVLTSVAHIGDEQAAPEERQVLLSHVRQIDIAYFGPDRLDGEARWRRSWLHSPYPPQIVRIRLAFGPGDTRTWSDLLIHPRATVDTRCALNPLAHGCKGRA